MIKTALISTATIFGAMVPAGHLMSSDPVSAEQIILPLPDAEVVVAQFSYLEISHDHEGFNLAISDKTAMFVALEFPGEFQIRIGI